MLDYLRTIFHLTMYKLCDNISRQLLLEDTLAFMRHETRFSDRDENVSLEVIARYLIHCKEYRNVFYYRIAKTSHRFHMGKILWLLLPPLDSLMFGVKGPMGGGIFIQHGFSTVIHAQSIGNNFFVNQQVTIGAGKTPKDIPVIGNNVKVHAGAIVIGNINIGDGATIGAGAVVYKDVPANATVVGSPSRIIKDGVIVLM